MSFLFPAMLAGLAALAVPIALHLIARHRFPIQDFPSIRLLQKDVRTNVFAPRLVDVPQLLLRLLVLTLLVLAMARLFSGGSSSSVEAPRNLVIVLDCSAGMRAQTVDEKTKQKLTLLERAKSEAKALIASLGANSQCAVILAEDRARVLLPLQDNPAAALQAIDQANTVDSAGCGTIRAVAVASELLSGRREAASQIVVFTDMRANAFAARDKKDMGRIATARSTAGSRLQVAFVDLLGPAPLNNVAVVDAHVRGRGVRAGDDAHVVAKVVNSGAEKTVAKMRLQIGDRKEPQIKEIPLEPGAEAVVDMTARVQRAANSVASIHIAEDAMSFDDAFHVPLNISDTRRLLIISGATQAAPESANNQLNALSGSSTPGAAETEESGLDGATILRYVLNPGRELGAAHGTGIEVTAVSPEGLAGQTLSKFDAVLLYDVSSLPDAALEDLVTFVKEGRAVLIFCAGKCQALGFNRTVAAGTARRPALAPAQIGNDLALEQAAEIQQAANLHPLLTPFQDRLQGDLSVIRFGKLREVQNVAEGAQTALTSTTGQLLAVEQSLGRGRVLLYTFGVELERGNIARARAFPALMWRTIAYLTGQLRQRPPDVVRASTPAVLDVSEPALSFADAVDLVPEIPKEETGSSAVPLRLAASDDRTIQVPPLKAGKFLLAKSGQASPSGESTRAGYTRYVTASVDPAESDTRRQPDTELATLFAGDVRVLTPNAISELSVKGSEFWRILVLLLAAAYFGEGALGYVLSRKRERERSGGPA